MDALVAGEFAITIFMLMRVFRAHSWEFAFFPLKFSKLFLFAASWRFQLFCCWETMRGDFERRFFWGFSEAQWTSMLLMSVVVSCEFGGMLPLERWHPVVTLVLL